MAESKHQAAIDTIQAALAIKHEQERIISKTLSQVPGDPFEDPKCNKRYKRVVRWWGRHVSESNDVHDELHECAAEGDGTAKFGGK